jgi:rhodanese-related sulfurtransferase
MPNPFGVPEITVRAVDEKRQAGEAFILLDVREPHELAIAAIVDERVLTLPLSDLAQRFMDAVPVALQTDKECQVVVFCHHGMRSAQVAAWLIQQGWVNTVNMEGGIAAWASQIDPTMGTY